MKLKKLPKTLKRLIRGIAGNHIDARASSCAFFIFLSLIPMLLLICSLLPLTGLNRENLIVGISGVIPEGIFPLAVSIVNEVYGKSGTIISVSALLTLWSAGKGVMSLINALNAVWEINDNRNFILKRLIACAHTLLILALIIASLLVMVFGEAVSALVLAKLPDLLRQVELIMAFRFIYGWLLFSVFFLIMYRYLPGTKMKLKQQIPGSLFTGIAWSVFSYGFSLYITHFKPYGMYGSMGGIILAMLWMYFCMYIVMIGAVINRSFSQTPS